MNIMSIPGFTAEFALSTAGRGYRQSVSPRTDGSRASMVEAAMISTENCRLDGTITTWEEGVGWHTANIYKCTIDLGGGGGGGGSIPVPSGPRRGGGGGGGATEPPKRKCRQARGPVERQGVNWRRDCVSSPTTSCCQNKAKACNTACGNSGSNTSTDCKNQCDASSRVCRDARNPKGPEVCSVL